MLSRPRPAAAPLQDEDEEPVEAACTDERLAVRWKSMAAALASLTAASLRGIDGGCCPGAPASSASPSDSAPHEC